MIGLERLSQHCARAGGSENEVLALQYQQRSAAIAAELHRSAPGSWFVARTYLVAQHLLLQRALAAQRQDLALNAIQACRAALRQAVAQRMEMDAPMRALLQPLDQLSS